MDMDQKFIEDAVSRMFSDEQKNEVDQFFYTLDQIKKDSSFGDFKGKWKVGFLTIYSGIPIPVKLNINIEPNFLNYYTFNTKDEAQMFIREVRKNFKKLKKIN
jgi:hypothetical protein